MNTEKMFTSTGSSKEFTTANGCYSTIMVNCESPRDMDLMETFLELMGNMRADDLECKLKYIKSNLNG